MQFKIKNKNGVTLQTKGKYCRENVVVSLEDYDKIIPENIAKDVTILGVTGAHEGGSSGVDTTDATATASDIMVGKTAYVNDEKIVGTIEVYKSEASEDVTPDIDKFLIGELTEYYNDRITTLRQNAFTSCSKLVKVCVPNVKTVNNLAFASCANLKTIDISSCETLNGQPFQSCSRLLRVIIRQTNKVCNMLYSSIFATCYRFVGATHVTYNPEGLKDGYIYVPDELVEQYKVATNWSTYADQIKPLSEYVED